MAFILSEYSFISPVLVNLKFPSPWYFSLILLLNISFTLLLWYISVSIEKTWWINVHCLSWCSSPFLTFLTTVNSLSSSSLSISAQEGRLEEESLEDTPCNYRNAQASAINLINNEPSKIESHFLSTQHRTFNSNNKSINSICRFPPLQFHKDNNLNLKDIGETNVIIS